MAVLIVEDDPRMAALIKTFLEAKGFPCLIAPDTASAQAILEREEVEALTLDLVLPDRYGLDWLEEVVTTRPKLGLRTVVVSGDALTVQKKVRIAACGAGWLIKPFRMEYLQEIVRSLVSEGEASDPRRVP